MGGQSSAQTPGAPRDTEGCALVMMDKGQAELTPSWGTAIGCWRGWVTPWHGLQHQTAMGGLEKPPGLVPGHPAPQQAVSRTHREGDPTGFRARFHPKCF